MTSGMATRRIAELKCFPPPAAIVCCTPLRASLVERLARRER